MKAPARSSPLRAIVLRHNLVLGLVPLVVVASVAVVGLRHVESRADESIATARSTLARETVAARLRSDAASISQEVEVVLSERMNDVVTWSRQPVVIDGALTATELAEQGGLPTVDPAALEIRFQAQGSLRSGPLVDAFLAAEQARLPEFVDILYTERHGFTAGLVGEAEDFVHNDETWWQEAWESGTHIGSVSFRPETGGHVVVLAARIEDDEGMAVGVLRASLDIGVVHAIADRRVASGVHVTIVNGEAELLAETGSGHDPTRIGTAADGPLLPSNGDGALGDRPGSTVGDDAVYGFAPVTAAAGGTDGPVPLDWHVVTTQDASVALAPLAGFDQLGSNITSATSQLMIVLLAVVTVAALGTLALAVIMSERLVDPFRRLAVDMRRAADESLPAALRALTEIDSDIDVTTHADGLLDAGPDASVAEVADLAGSFAAVQLQALRLGAMQTTHRRDTSRMFANLGRRNQSLVKRQLRLIDELEQSEDDPDRLASLYRLDHLATRMRRNAESLLVIAGHRTVTKRTPPLQMELVVRGALGEVEDYDRVDVNDVEPMAVSGRAVGDVAHILAELVENAVAVSPPGTEVEVGGRSHVNGYSLTVVDRGIGLSELELATLNERLRGDAAVDEMSSSQLGLLVVAMLAARHGITVRLAESDGGGVAATVLLPHAIVVAAESAAPVRAGSLRRRQSLGRSGANPPRPPASITAATPDAPDDPTADAATRPQDRPGPAVRHDDTPVTADDHAGLTDRRRTLDTPPEPNDADPIAAPRPRIADPAARIGDLSVVSASQITHVTRRVSRRSPGAAARTEDTTPKVKRPVAVTTSDDEVAAEAARTGNRWSSFQRGRRQAVADDRGEPAEPVPTRPQEGPDARQ
ncbi:MAG: ATP-binding protein [Acidimicrobiales bacterium]